MKISLVTVGWTKSNDLASSIADYSKRLSHYTNFEFIEVNEQKLVSILGKYDRVFLLDDKGKEYSSVEFSLFIEKQLNASVQNIAFVIGGPFGFAPEIIELTDSSVSLSKMTFPHDLVRVIFLEQLYRAFTILKNEKYHHE